MPKYPPTISVVDLLVSNLLLQSLLLFKKQQTYIFSPNRHVEHASNMTLRYCSFDLGDSGPIDIHRNGCIIIFSRDICPKSKVVPVCCWSKSPNNIQSHRVEIQSTAFGCESGANEKIHFENPSTISHPAYPGDMLPINKTSLNKLWFRISPIISWLHYISLELIDLISPINL